MSDIIKLLPDSVANQIAAGEVVQRPASVVKELMENAIDAGATQITVIIKDAGRTLIQIIDNGKGMSITDARMAFERHATSKISSAEDLFAIHSMGFRGEALASIAAVAEVVLKTRREEDETGIEITVSASEVLNQEPSGCPIGSNFAVKNLFFNIPARRKFLKSDSHEFRLIVQDFQRVALAFPSVSMSLQHNNNEIFKLNSTNCRQRIVQLFGKTINQSLIDVETRTTIAEITGFIGKPETSKKYASGQFFFVNNRFMKHPYFHKAVVTALEKIITPDMIPPYFIYLQVPPERIDINIHPTKTEIKFEDEQAIWQILNATIRQSIGRFNVIPSIDFNTENAIEIPILSKTTEFHVPEIKVNPLFNPFDTENESPAKRGVSAPLKDFRKEANLGNWEDLYKGFENKNTIETGIPEKSTYEGFSTTTQPSLFQLKGKYILSPVKSGLMIVDQHRAHKRILYEKYLQSLSGSQAASQQTLFPVVIELSEEDYNIILEILDELHQAGFDFNDFGNRSISISGLPAWLSSEDPKSVFENLMNEYKTRPVDLKQKAREDIALLLSNASAIQYYRTLTVEEMRDLIDNLFQCADPNYSPDGKMVLSIIPLDEIEKKLK